MSTNSYTEDKTCRICGTVDTKNLNIFDARNKSLLYKILTIFPITLYESDPLPKNICKKCFTNVQQMHDECQRLVKVQQKWVDNVRVNQPDHPYVTVLNIIEECHQDMLSRIKAIAPDFIYKNIRLLRHDFTQDEDRHDSNITNNSVQQTAEVQKIAAPLTIASLSFDFDDGGPLNGQRLSFPKPAVGNQRRSSIKEIQHKLQSNGCTLLVKPPFEQPEVKPKISRNTVRLTAHCKYCRARFPNQQFLAKHQLEHLSVSDRRIFDRKYLEKSVRRGRLIPVDDKKCIRCLNCWKLFADNRKILEHWSNADCEYFCQICGMEFSKNPKQLREHVPEVHGITYRSSRRQTANIPEVRILNQNELEDVDVKPTLPILPVESPPPVTHPPPPPLVKKPELTKERTCELCGMKFPNYQSKNSHMRKHRQNSNAASAKSIAQHMEMPILTPCQIKTEKPPTAYEVAEQQTASDEPPIKKEKIDEEIETTLKNAGGVSRGRSQNSPVKQAPVPVSKKPAVIAKTSPQTDAAKKTTKPAAGAKKPIETDANQLEKLYNCHPCGKKFVSKTDLFQHKRLCQSNNKFVCRFCLRAFVTSADLQMHIMLMHKGS